MRDSWLGLHTRIKIVSKYYVKNYFQILYNRQRDRPLYFQVFHTKLFSTSGVVRTYFFRKNIKTVG